MTEFAFYDIYAGDTTKPLRRPKEKNKAWYMATPYSLRATGGHPDDGLNKVFMESLHCAITLTRDVGLSVFSPIVQSHLVAGAGKMDPLDGKLWRHINAPFLRAFDGLLVMALKGAQESEGIAWEMEEFQRQVKPVYIVTAAQPDAGEETE